jgi:hypothetical protein
MLAMADETGFVAASVPGLTKRAGVTRDECQAALAAFLGPDPDSRTKDHGGRRIAEADGGWLLLNYEKYREIRNKEDRREYQARWARSKRASTDIDTRRQTSTKSTQAESEADADAEEERGGGGGAGALPAVGEKTQSPVKAVIAKIAPLWSRKYGRQLVASREDRRSLGVMLQAFAEAGGKAEAELADLPRWYAAFLADDREAYVKQAHSLRQFLDDMNVHRLSKAERLHPNGRLTPEEWRSPVNELPKLPKGEPRPKEASIRLHGSPADTTSGVGEQQEATARGGR